MKVGILITEEINSFRHNLLYEIINSGNDLIFFIDVSKKTDNLQKLKHHLTKKRGFYILIMVIKRIFSSKEKTYRIGSLIKDYQIFKTEEPYSKISINQIKKIKPDVLVNISGFGRLIKKSILSIPKHGVLSFHHGDMRKYRGQPAGFWELFNYEREMMITVQILSEKLDAGIPIVEKKILIDRMDNVKTLRNKLYKESKGLMVKAMNEIESFDSGSKKIDKLGKVYTIPNFRQWFIYCIRLLKRKVKN